MGLLHGALGGVGHPKGGPILFLSFGPFPPSLNSGISAENRYTIGGAVGQPSAARRAGSLEGVVFFSPKNLVFGIVRRG